MNKNDAAQAIAGLLDGPMVDASAVDEVLYVMVDDWSIKLVVADVQVIA